MTSVLSMESQHVSSSFRGRNLDACNSSRDRSLSASTAANSEVDFPFDAAWGSDAEDSEDDTNAAIQEAIYEAKSPRRSLAAQRKPRWADLEDSEEDSSPETTSEEFQTTIRASLAADTMSSSGSSSSSSGDGQQSLQVAPTATSSAAAAASPESTLHPSQADDAAVKPQRRQRGKRGGARHKDKQDAAKHGDQKDCEKLQVAPQAWNKQWQADKSISGRSTSSWQNNNKHGGCGDDGEKQSWNSAPKDHKYWRQQQQAQQEPQKQQCQFNVGIDEDKKFGVVRRLIGSHGMHVKRIAEDSGAKLRLRGRGSKFLEGPEQQESPDPLMLCISAPDQWSYAKAVRLVSDHLEKIYADYRAHCEKKNLTVKDLCIDMHEGRREGNYY